jgi:hypothetical protein
MAPYYHPADAAAMAAMGESYEADAIEAVQSALENLRAKAAASASEPEPEEA